MKISAIAKSIRISEILLAVLLVSAVWVNRPPFVYINKTHGAKGEVLYNLCMKYHRWGTLTECTMGNPDYYRAEDDLRKFNDKLDNMSLHSSWKLLP